MERLGKRNYMKEHKEIFMIAENMLSFLKGSFKRGVIVPFLSIPYCIHKC